MNSLSVNELIVRLEEIKQEGHGDMRVLGGISDKLGYGIVSVKGIQDIKLDTLFSEPMIFIRLN